MEVVVEHDVLAGSKERHRVGVVQHRVWSDQRREHDHVRLRAEDRLLVSRDFDADRVKPDELAGVSPRLRRRVREDADDLELVGAKEQEAQHEAAEATRPPDDNLRTLHATCHRKMPDCVEVRDLRNFVVRDAGEVLGGDRLILGPRRLGMGEVGLPQHVVDADTMPLLHPEPLIDQRHEDAAAEDVRRATLQSVPSLHAFPLEVGPLEQVWEVADAELRHDELQVRELGGHPAGHQLDHDLPAGDHRTRR